MHPHISRLSDEFALANPQAAPLDFLLLLLQKLGPTVGPAILALIEALLHPPAPTPPAKG